MKRIFILCGILVSMILSLQAQTPQEIADRIRSQESKYKWGEARGITEKDAKNAAIASLIENIRLGVTIANDAKTGYDSETGGEESYSTKMSSVSFMSLPNTETLYWEETTADGKTSTRAFVYVSIADMEMAAQERREKIAEMVRCGTEQEGTMNIAGALRYYNWALTMAVSYKDKVKATVNGVEKDVAIWLPNKIENMLHKVKVSFDGSPVLDDGLGSDRYSVIGNVTYDGRPVMGLDLTYFNGERQIKAHAKDGEVILSYSTLPADDKIDLKVEYEYAEEAKKSYDEDIASAMADGSAFTNFAVAQLSIPVQLKKGKIKEGKQSADDNKISAAAAAEETLYKEPDATIQRSFAFDEAIMDKMKEVEDALRTGNYSSVESLFTEDGYKRFRRMTGNGTIKVIGTPDYSIEKSPLFTIGKSIPVAVTQARHVSKEKIVFRFDKVSGLISSVAYGLTKRAEDDIFRKATWNIDSRYSLLTFMEDYQTAYILQDIDYIREIFSDDAIIIVGKYEDAGALMPQKGFKDGSVFGARGPKINYTRFDKDTYLKNLAGLFKRNDWTHISFEENDIEKINTGKLLDNEALWIEIRQNWSVASGYNDTGYLALQLNLKQSGSRINVRTFTPEFIPINQLKTQFPVGVGNENKSDELKP